MIRSEQKFMYEVYEECWRNKWSLRRNKRSWKWVKINRSLVYKENVYYEKIGEVFKWTDVFISEQMCL